MKASSASHLYSSPRRHAHGPLAFSHAESVGYIIGAYGEKAGNPDIGKFILTLRKDAQGRWLITADMDNGNTPPRRPSPPPGS